MPRQQAFKFELIPNGEQERDMRKFAGARRFVYNKALAHQQAHYAAGGKFIRYEEMAKLLSQWRTDAETSWLKESPYHTLQHALKDLDRAYKNFFKKIAAFPTPKRKNDRGSFRYPDSKQFKLDESNARIFLPKLGWMRYRKSRKVLGQIKNITVTQSAGKWFMSIQTEREVEVAAHPKPGTAIALDAGARKDWAILVGSDGNAIKSLNAYRNSEKRIKYLNRCLSRKKKGSKNRAKCKARLARLQAKVKNQRNDHLNKISARLTNEFETIIIEELAVKKMIETGPRLKSKAIADQGWGMLRIQLEYKSTWKGGFVLAVDPAETSTTCSSCGHNEKSNRTTSDKFKCVSCGFEMQADKNAALNILERGQCSSIACGENGSGLARKRKTKPISVKQEPAEVTKQGVNRA